MEIKKIPFGDLFSFLSKSKIKAGNGLDSGKYKFFTSSGVQKKFINVCHYKGDSLIFGTGGHASVHFCSENFSSSTDCFVTQPINGKIDSRFTYYFFTRNIHLLEAGFKGAGLKHISKEYLKQIPIPIFDLKTQQKIAIILEQADTARQKRKQANKLTEQFLQSAFLEMFGDPVKNEKRFKIVTIEDVIDQIKDGPHVSPKYSEGGIPILSTRNVRPYRLLLDDLKYVSEKEYNYLTRNFRPRQGDVLLTKGGTTGFAKRVDFDWKFCVWVHIAVLRPKNTIVPVYLESTLNSEYCYNQSQFYTHGIANRDLGLKRIAKIKLLLPPLTLQQKFALLVERIEKLNEKQRESERELENLFQALMQKYFG